MSTSTTLPDIQKTVDTRGVRINQVGVTGIRMPIRLLRKADGTSLPQSMDTVGEFELSVDLPAEVKGTHMSRFTEVLQSHVDSGGIFSHKDLTTLARELNVKLGGLRSVVCVYAEYFVPQNSPTTGRRGVAPLKVFLEVEYRADNPFVSYLLTTGVEMIGKTCCPCSREISDFDPATGRGKGAHAQRSAISITVRHAETTMIWFEDLVEICWKSYSSPVYPVLKRPDERTVTMTAYENPKFVEDVIRDATTQLRALISRDDRATFKVRVQNAESIHYHDAFACVSE